MKITQCVFSLILVCVQGTSLAQTAAYQLLSYPRSIISSGMGEQGAAMKDPADAMQYNPANLIYTETGALSYFVNPLMMGYSHVPQVSKSISMKLSGGVAAGLEYNNWAGGNPLIDDYGPWDYQSYQQSIAGTFAISLGTDWAVGAQVRYAWSPLIFNRTASNLLFGAGASYTPAALSQRLTVGLALMNFGTPIEYTPPDPEDSDGLTGPMPAQFNVAADYTLVRQRYYDIAIDLGFTKPFVTFDTGHGQSYQSSYRALFTDWNEFPRDVTTHIGLGCQWKPLPLGGGVSFFQEMSLGYIGASMGSTTFFTHGVRAGIEALGMKAAIGYAGRWHNNYSDEYLRWAYPWEMFQLTLSGNWNAPEIDGQESGERNALKGILLSGGYTFSSPFKESAEEAFTGKGKGFTNQQHWFVEAAFYLSDKTALITSLGYSYMTSDGGIWLTDEGGYYRAIDRMDELTLESGIRYHPLVHSDPFFIQASVGIVRFNPITENTYLQSAYKEFVTAAAGWVIPINDAGLTLVPKLGIRTVVMDRTTMDGHLKGFPEFVFGINIGYML
jgi:hypothetical protein